MLPSKHVRNTTKAGGENDPRIKPSAWIRARLSSGTFVYFYSGPRFVTADINAENAGYCHGCSLYFIKGKQDFSIPELSKAFVRYGTLYYIDNKKFAHPCVQIELEFNTNESCDKFMRSMPAGVHLRAQTAPNKVDFFTKSREAYIACLNLIFSPSEAKYHDDLFFKKHVIYKGVDLYLASSSKARPVAARHPAEGNTEACCDIPVPESSSSKQPRASLFLTTSKQLLDEDNSVSSSDTASVVATDPVEVNVEASCGIPVSESPKQPSSSLFLTTSKEPLDEDNSVSSSEAASVVATNPAENHVEARCGILSSELSPEHSADKLIDTPLNQPGSNASSLKKSKSKLLFFSGSKRNITSQHSSKSMCFVL